MKKAGGLSKGFSFFIFFLLMVASEWSQAYVPPSGYLVKSVSSKHVAPKGFKLQSKVFGLDSNAKVNTPGIKLVTSFFPQQNLFRIAAWDESGQKIYQTERKFDTASLPLVLLSSSDARVLTLALKAKGIPVQTEDDLLRLETEMERVQSEVTSLARWKSKLAWVMGKTDPKLEIKKAPTTELTAGERVGLHREPQLWIEKDRFLPVRLIYASPQEQWLDYHLDETRFSQEFPFPRLITVYRDQVPLLKEEFSEFQLGVDPQELKTPWPSGWTPVGQGAGESLRSAVDQIFQTLR